MRFKIFDEEFLDPDELMEEFYYGLGSDCENFYRILENDTSTVIEDSFGGDIFSDANGVKNTVDTGDTTMFFTSSHYELDFNDEASGDTTTSSGFSNTGNAFDSDDGTASTSSASDDATHFVGKTFTAKTVKRVRLVYSMGFTVTDPGGSITLYLDTYDGATWSQLGSFVNGAVRTSGSWSSSGTTVRDINSSIQGIRARIVYDRDGGSYSGNCSIFSLEYGATFASSGLIKQDTNLLSLDGEEVGIAGFLRGSLPDSTNAVINASDGTTTTSNTRVDWYNKYFFIPTSSLASGTLTLNTTCSTSNNTVTPEIEGISYKLIKGDNFPKPTVTTTELTSANPTLNSSAFSGFKEATHQSTDWEVRRQSDDVLVFSSYNDTSNLTSITLTGSPIADSTEYRIKVRYKDNEDQLSGWGTKNITSNFP